MHPIGHPLLSPVSARGLHGEQIDENIESEVASFLDEHFMPIVGEGRIGEIIEKVAAEIGDLTEDEIKDLKRYEELCRNGEVFPISRKEERGVSLLIRYLKNFIQLPLDTLLNALRFPEIGRGSSSWFEASSFFSIYGAVGAFIAAVFGTATFFFPGFTFVQRLFVTGCILACMGVAAGYYIIHKKPADRLPYTVANLNFDAKRGLLPRQYGREGVVEELFGWIGAARGRGEHAKILLKGESGVGKSSIMQQFARKAVENPERQLSEVPIYVLNMGDMARNPLFGFVGSVLLEFILLSMGGHEAILVLEEVHAVFSDPSCSLANYIKDRLDRTTNVHVVGITTDKEYKEHMEKDGAFTGRFSSIDVHPLPTEETLMVLRRHFEMDPFFDDATDDELHRLIEKSSSNSRSQPAAALGACREVKSYVEQIRLSSLGKEKLLNEREFLVRQLLCASIEKEPEITSKIDLLDEGIKELTLTQKKLQQEFDDLEKIGKIYQTSVEWMRSSKKKTPQAVVKFKRVWKPKLLWMRSKQKERLKQSLNKLLNRDNDLDLSDTSFSLVLENCLKALGGSV